MIRELITVALLFASDVHSGARIQDDVRSQVRALVDRGKLADAERVAREGGKPATVVLGDVLVLRGRLAAADSIYRRAIADRVSDQIDAEVALAELASRRGDRAEATRRARLVVDQYDRSGHPAGMHLAAGRAWLLLGVGNPDAPRRALSAFDAAAAARPDDPEPKLLVGELFLEKYNAPDARTSFKEVLEKDPDNARALLGIARVDEFDGTAQAIDGVRKSISANPSLVPALNQLARLHLEAETFDSAAFWARRALSVDSSSVTAWSLLGATAWLTGDSTMYRQAKDAATRLQPQPSEFYSEIADAAVRTRRYADAMRMARTAVALDSFSSRALGIQGTNAMRLGDVEEARTALERAFQIDAFNLWNKNTLDLLDKLRDFRTIESGRFRIVAPKDQADLVALYLVPLLEQAYDSLAKRYNYKPVTPVRLEVYGSHADFSVRTVGLAGLGALGVSFGNVLAMDAPNARERGSFNWGSTAWHELTHAFSLGASDNRVPRWFSEGLSVLEERRAGRGWGADASVPFIAAYGARQLRPISKLNEGFLNPRNPLEIQFSYYLASLFCEMVEEQQGAKGLVAMLSGWREGLETPAVFQRTLHMTPAQVDAAFDTWMKKRFAAPLQSIAGAAAGPEGMQARGPFVEAIRAAMEQVAAGRKDSARVLLEHAQALFPEYAGPDSPAIPLATLYSERGETRKALEQVMRVTARNETAWEANDLEATLRNKLADSVGVQAALERMIWMWPYDAALHGRLATLAMNRGDHATSVRERRAILALDPADPLDARYELARALMAAGDLPAARRELLAVLERAPSFEKAQMLLLELREREKRSGTR